jgi:hypothetical protein
MNNQDIFAAFIFHIIITICVLLNFELWAAILYAAITLFSTVIISKGIYNFFAYFWGTGFSNRKTSLSRGVTDPFIAIANIIFTALLVRCSFWFENVGDTFKKVEDALHAGAVNGAENIQGAVTPEASNIASNSFFYIADQLSSVIGIPSILFTILSIILILLIELSIFIGWKKYKN